jgi:hypothetical protein
MQVQCHLKIPCRVGRRFAGELNAGLSREPRIHSGLQRVVPAAVTRPSHFAVWRHMHAWDVDMRAPSQEQNVTKSRALE